MSNDNEVKRFIRRLDRALRVLSCIGAVGILLYFIALLCILLRLS